MIPKKIALIIKHHQPEATALGLSLARVILSHSKKVLFSEENKGIAWQLSRNLSSQVKDQVQVLSKSSLIKMVDLIIVVGGDGTFLSIARLIQSREVPILGIHMGRLGFLTEIKRTEALRILEQIFKDKPLPVSKRVLFEVHLERNGKTILQGPVVNDAVISKGAIARIIGLQILVNGKWVHNVLADGMIVSTPTGSTAYSLAAGGPIIEPKLGAMILTPICPHSLTQRPLVIRDDSEIQIRLDHRPGHVLLTLDGQDAIAMKKDDMVTVRKLKGHSLKLISSPSRDYFGLLREKLKLGYRD